MNKFTEMAYSVYRTSNLNIFEVIGGNRGINSAHLHRLIESIKDRNLLDAQPIVVNEKMQVIDGQHRLAAAKALGLDVTYIVRDGLGLDDVKLLNSNTRNWTTDDYLEAYIQSGSTDYIIYKDFKERHNLGHIAARLLLAGSGYGRDTFKYGHFKVKDLEEAEKLAGYLNDFGELYDGTDRRVFIRAFMSIVAIPNYNHSRMINNLKRVPMGIKDSLNVREYLRQLEEIYNYRTKGDRVRFF